MASRKGEDVSDDLLLRQRDENVNLKKQMHEHETTIKRLQTQIRIKDAANKRDGTTELVNAAEVAEMETEMEEMRRKNRQLTDRLRLLENTIVQKAQAQGKTVDYGRAPRPGKKPISVGVHSPSDIAGGKYPLSSNSRASSAERGSSVGRRGGGGESKTDSKSMSPTDLATPRSAGRGYSASSSSQLHHSSDGRPSTAPSPGLAASALYSGAESARLAAVESHLQTLRGENDALRRQLADANANARSLSSMSAAAGASAGPSSRSQDPNSVSLPRSEFLELERQLKDKTSQVLLLKSRFEHLENKAAAERELYDRAVSALEEQNAQIRDARAALQAAEGDVSLLRSRLRAQEDGDSELRSAREETRRLERTLTELCESPFLADGRDRVAQSEKAEQSIKEAAAAKEQVTHLQHSVRSQYLELNAIKKEKKDLSDANDQLRAEVEALRISCDAAARANSTLRERLALYSGVVGMEGTASAAHSSTGGGAGGSAALGSSHGGHGHGHGHNDGIGASVPPEELERALTIVRKRLDNPGSITSAHDGTGNNDAESTPILRRKVQQLQLAMLSSQRELERCDAMLRAQTSIAQDLSAEVTELNERLASETATIKRRLADTESLAESRLQRANALEVQVKSLVEKLKEVSAVATERKKVAKEATRVAAAATAANANAGASYSLGAAAARRASGIGMPTSSNRRGGVYDDADDDASTVISALSGEEDDRADDFNGGVISSRTGGHRGGGAGGAVDDTADDSLGSSLLDFGPGEDALEIYIVDATLDPAVLGRHDATFALIDFYDFDSQTSPMLMGPAPSYNFSAAYRVVTDSFFLRNVATRGITIDINQARGAEFDLLARAVVPIHKLLLNSTTKLKFASIPLVSKAGRVIGSLRIEVRVAVALSGHWDNFNREQPAEGARLSAIMRDADSKEQTEAASSSAATAAPTAAGASTMSASSAATVQAGSGANELVVTVVGASSLRRSAATGGQPPSAYVQYKLPGMATAVTPVVRGSGDPVFADSRTFPFVPSARILASLASAPIQFEVIDDSVAAAAAATTSSNKGSAASSQPPSAFVGVAAVSMSALADGGAIDASYDIIDANGHPAGKLHVRARWSRPLAPVDGAPPDALTRPQLNALASVFDRDGAGVKHELLYLVSTLRDDEAKALDRVRESIAMHERAWHAAGATGASAASSSRRPVLKWSRALSDAAEAAGRPGGLVTPKEVHAALVAPAVGVAIDADAVYLAMAGLLQSSTSSCPVADIIDVFSTLTPAAASGISKLRKFVAGMAVGRGLPRLDYALEDEAEAAARRVYGERPTRQQMERLSRSGLAAALKYCGMVIVEDGTATRSSARDPRDAADFGADPRAGVASVAEAIAAASSSSSATAIVDDGVVVHPALVTEAAAAAIASVASNSSAAPVAAIPAAASSSISGPPAPSSSYSTSADASSSIPVRRSSSVKELVFDNASAAAAAAVASASSSSSSSTSVVAGPPAPGSASGTAEAAVVAAPAGKLRRVDSHAGPEVDASTPALSVHILAIGRLHSTLSSASSLFLSYSVPALSAAAGAGCTTVTPVLQAQMGSDGKSATFVPYARAAGAGSAFGATTSFSLTPGSALSSVFASCLGAGGIPEESDISFTLSSSPPTIDTATGAGSFSSPSDVLASTSFSLLDLLVENKDANELDLPLLGSGSGSGSSSAGVGGGVGATVADLHVTITGWKALKEAVDAGRR